MHTQPGNNNSCNLENYVGKVVSVPIFDCTLDTLLARARSRGRRVTPAPPGNGCNAYYHRVGYAAFYLWGYSVTTPAASPTRSKIKPNTTMPAPAPCRQCNPCKGSASCISGLVHHRTLSATTISGPPSGGGFFGTFAVVPAG